jgi:hypothetical protein
MAAEVLHVPVPLQVRAGVNELAAHAASTQTVPAPYLRQAPEPSQVPSVPHEGLPASVHWLGGTGACPAGITLHVPRLPGRAQDWQVPVQAVAQQTDWLQFPCRHSLPFAQAAPSDFFPHCRAALHTLGLRHSVEAAVHDVKHAPAAPHTYGVQVDCVPGWHTPAPLHWGADVNVEPGIGQVVAPQIVPAAYRRQLPAPSQVPSVPHVVVAAAAHWLSGSVVAAASVHVPTVPGSAHERQVPVHELAQQTFCWHCPDWHSVPAVHAAALSFFEQTPLLQTKPVAQSPSIVQVVRQVLFVLQAYVPQEAGVPTWHVPAPLQVRACVYVPVTQVSAAHVVPAT